MECEVCGAPATRYTADLRETASTKVDGKLWANWETMKSHLYCDGCFVEPELTLLDDPGGRRAYDMRMCQYEAMALGRAMFGGKG